MPLILGVDSSTQSTKVEARELDSGAVVATGRAAHPHTTPPVSEQDPEAWWDALIKAVTELGPHRSDVVAMSVGGQQHGLVLLDESGRPLRPAKLWNDTTSARQADRLVSELGPEKWASGTGSVPLAAFTITKLAWVADHEPDLIGQIAHMALPHDYLTWRLTGNHVTDRGDASGSGWFDPVQNVYRPELIDMAATLRGQSWLDLLPSVLGPTDAAGSITAAAADMLGLPGGVMVGAGSGDNMAAALGLGLKPGDVAISLGTSGTAFALSDTPTADQSGAVAGFASASGSFLPLVCTLNATKVTDTVAAWLGTDPAGLADLALTAELNPGSVSLVPYFDGERTPNRPYATGTFHGLTNQTTSAQLALAAHDGVLCGLLDGVDALRKVGASTSGRIFLVGGGARSRAYRQRCADLSQKEVVVPEADETVAAGAAVQAAAVVSRRSLESVSDDWGLGAGVTVESQVDATDLRARYAQARRSEVSDVSWQ